MTVTIGRRELLVALGEAAAAWPLATHAQQPVVPENPICPDSRDETESAHHAARCLHSFSCLGRLSPT